MANQTSDAVTSRRNRTALESGRLEPGGVPDANRDKGRIRVNVDGSHAGGRFRRDARLASSTVSARGARRDPHDVARRGDVDGDGAAKHRDAVERLRERDVTHACRSTDVVAHDRQRVQVSVLESEPVGVPHQPVPQGDRERRPGSGPSRCVQDAKRARIRVQARAAPARDRLRGGARPARAQTPPPAAVVRGCRSPGGSRAVRSGGCWRAVSGPDRPTMAPAARMRARRVRNAMTRSFCRAARLQRALSGNAEDLRRSRQWRVHGQSTSCGDLTRKC